MKKYYVNSDTSSNPRHDHEVHTADCFWLPGADKRVYLGEFSSAAAAVSAARAYYSNVDGCATCCSEAHHG